MTIQSSHYKKASKVLTGGVNSSTRFNQAIQMPFYLSKGKGSKVTDLDGKEYVDMCCAHGAGLLGNAHPAIDEALWKTIEIKYDKSL